MLGRVAEPRGPFAALLDAAEVPRLVCAHGFRHGAVFRPRLSFFGAVARVRARAVAPAKRAVAMFGGSPSRVRRAEPEAQVETEHRVTWTGPILPTFVEALREWLEGQHARGVLALEALEGRRDRDRAWEWTLARAE